MNRMESLLQNWDFCYDKEDWYPPLADALKTLTAEQADWRPAGEHSNTIWETVEHLIFYKKRLLKRITGEESQYPEGLTNEDTFAVASKTESDWEATQNRLKSVHLGIRERITNLNVDQLQALVTNRPLDEWLNSLILHDVYHTGQIILIRKLQGSWPARRSFE
ncbi:DinB family protein [Bacillus clarus]|uniref:DinB family protein n=1 Tax=Bacillus clarus TaxID=2338372 RepID=A0A090YAT2_9BACI|nr:DinB family protein [Bacillus clarus]KFM95559.1 dinB family protein [Bacillus clarus]RFT61754.1 DinB family protein [Bacillus clarus]